MRPLKQLQPHLPKSTEIQIGQGRHQKCHASAVAIAVYCELFKPSPYYLLDQNFVASSQ